MTAQTEEKTGKRDQLIAVIADYKKTNQNYNTLFAFVYIKGLTNYSDDNCILILEQCGQRGIDPLTLMAIKGFSTWLEAGRVVRKGEKCFYILAPLVKRDEDEHEKVFGFKCAFVFDVSQTDEMSAEDRASHTTKASERTGKSAPKQKRAKHTRRSGSASYGDPYQQDQADTFTADERSRKASDDGPPWQPYTEEHRQRAREQAHAEAERQRQEDARRQAEREAADRERARRIFAEWEREQARAEAERQRQQQHNSRRGTLGLNDSEARAILGITGSLTADALKKAYRRAAKMNHPDHGGSEEAMKRVNLAHAYLKPYAC